EHLQDLLLAVSESRQTLITYQSARSTEPVEYQINPLALTQHRGSLYLVAFSHDHAEIRTFKLDRVEEVEVSALPFQPPDGFDVQEYFAGSFGVFHADGDIAVCIRFAPSAARYVREGQWHASQQLTCQKDGGLLAEFRLSGTEEIKRWVLSFGSAAVVLEPAALRDELAAELRQTIESYSTSAAPHRRLGKAAHRPTVVAARNGRSANSGVGQ
ncbi:MAG: helix-turn-helix transcriptional regulator, partial [Pirellulaceae bacterium]